MELFPLQYYAFVFFQFMLLLTLGTFFKSFGGVIEDEDNLRIKNSLGIFCLVLITLYIGVRPISGWFGDMVIYNKEIDLYIEGAPFDSGKDYVFELLKYFYAKVINAQLFFFTCALMYVIPLYWACKKIFRDYWFYAFLMIVNSFTFWTYGTNGIRNGVATTFFIYGISKNKKFSTYFWLIFAIFIHKSLLLPVMAYFLVINYSKTKTYLYLWLLAIPLSFLLGGLFESFFLNLGFAEDKLQGYLGDFNQQNEGVEINVGFRFDFLLYSFSGIYTAWYFIYKKKFEDVLYRNIVNVYIVTNIFWVLIIRANYSNRFAYLSWFLLGLVIIYPFLKQRWFKNQHLIVGWIIFGYFVFGYLLNILDIIKFIK